MNNNHISYEQEIANVIGARYSLNDQIAIIRQRDTKPDEFEAFFGECERIKAAVKAYRDAHPEEYAESEEVVE